MSETIEDTMWSKLDRAILAVLAFIVTGIGLDLLIKILAAPAIQLALAVIAVLTTLTGIPAMVVKAAYDNGWLDENR